MMEVKVFLFNDDKKSYLLKKTMVRNERVKCWELVNIFFSDTCSDANAKKSIRKCR